jgi:hypothetical protein
MSTLNVDKVDPSTGTALEIGSSGDTVTVPSGATFAVSGTMNASSITAGTIATARLGSGTASSSTVLYGDQTYKAEPGGGKIGQVVGSANAYGNNSSSTSYFDFQSSSGVTWEVAITPTATSSKIAVFYYGQLYFEHPNNAGGAYYLQYGINISREISGGSYAAIMSSERLGMYTFAGTAKHDSMPTIHMNYLDSPSTTSECKYKIQGKCMGQASTSLYYNYAPSATPASHIMLMEVLA